MTTIRKPATALGWFPHSAATDWAIIDMADSQQVTLRARLRNHYWLTECKPLGDTTVALIRKRMAMADLGVVMRDEQVSELLSDHFGFLPSDDGFVIPDLDEARGVAVTSLAGIVKRASAGGNAKAAKAAERTQAGLMGADPDPTDF